MPTLLEIITLGDPILRKSAESVKDVSDPAVQELLDNMLYTCRAHNAFGIAAPQVGVSKQIMIITSQPTPRYPQAEKIDPIFMINPNLHVFQGDEDEDGCERDLEGCLSIPGLWGYISRLKEITVSYTDRSGERHQRNLDGFLARIFQHEHDHLRGILFLDHIKRFSNDLMAEKYYQTHFLPGISSR